MSQIYFTSDLHFSHANIARFCPQFRLTGVSLKEMDDYMIKCWNAVVQPEDVVYNLGDVSLARDLSRVESVLCRLNGQHHLILGNHDGLIERNKEDFLYGCKEDGHPIFSSIQNYLELKLSQLDNKLVLFHYPIHEWNGCHKGWYHLYGHLHNRLAQIKGRALNVGWDLHGRFLTPTDIEKYLKDLPIVQHFGEKGVSESGDVEAQIKSKLAVLNA